MKTELSFKKLGWIIVLLLGIFISSCNKEVATDIPESGLALKSGHVPIDQVCDLIAGKTIDAGNVIYSNDGTSLTVTYLTTNGWTLSEVHLYVGTLDGLPTNKTAVQIGKFPYSKTDFDSGVTKWTFPPITLPQGDYIIAAHAVVQKVVNGLVVQEETAWANCTYKPIIVVKTTFSDNTWALTDGDLYFKSAGWVCPWLGINRYDKGDEYMLQSWIYPAAEGGAGKVEVSDDGVNLSVIVTPKEGLTLQTTHLFVGTMEELVELGQYTGGCPDYNLFPYKNSEVTPTHSFVIPIPAMPSMPNNVSFQSAPLNSSRWGWYSYYNF